MTTNSCSSSDTLLDAFSDLEGQLHVHYPNNTESSAFMDVHTPLSLHTDGDNVFFPELYETQDLLPLNPYGEIEGEIDWSLYQYNNPFSSPVPGLDHDNTSSVGTVDEPFSPVSDSSIAGPSLIAPIFKPTSTYTIGQAHFTNHFDSPLNLDVTASATGFTGFPDTSGLYNPMSGYGRLSHVAYRAATDVPSRPQRSQGVDVSVGEVPFPFTYPPPLVIADQEDPPAAPQHKEGRKASPTSSTPRRVTRGKTQPVNNNAADGEDPEGDDKPPKRGKPEYPCPQCPSVFDRSYNRNKHVASVHEGKKEHVCPHDKCAQPFARKHDLTRHIQSFHTDLGSPRRHPPASGGEHSGRAGKQKNQN
ncbi:transcription factor [Ganoderma sinense ZZ0214-1]|uniref:Transcription factor n=1 Tax=Ganoderma sinense ZZ0214-1 TaxID=1077348 RepID=A0A2G8RPH0_9APHY|nr:transcription factor [Ganoderma sinense ZZ0214-1]